MTGPIKRLPHPTPGGWVLAATLSLAIGVSAWMLQTPSPQSDSGPLGSFPGLRAQETLARLMGPGLPHPIGSLANEEVRARIVDALEDIGLSPQIQSRFVCGTFRRYCGTVSNVVVRIEGKNREALLLNSHYDSQPATPGAADPMTGVAVLIEIARMFAQAPPPERSLVFLFNDGEEAGLLGATAFVEHHPWAADVRAVVNLDARGSGGPSFPAYTVGNDRAVLGPFAAAGGRVPGGSALRAISALLPNTNDLAVFDRLDVPGVMFGFARHIRHYHTPRDDLAHLNLGSLQQQGSQALAVARALASGSDAAKDGRLTFVSIGPLVLRWPERVSGVVALVLATSFVLLLGNLLRQGAVTIRETLWGAAGFPLTLVVTFLGSAIVNALRKGVTPLPLVWVSQPGPTVLGFGAVAAVWLFVGALLFRRRAGAIGFWAATGCWWCVLAVAVGFLAPGFGYLFSVPVGAAVLGAAILVATRRSTDRASGAGVAVAWGLPAAVTIMVWLPHLGLLLDLIGLGAMPPLATLFALALTPAVPMLLTSRNPWLWPAVLLVVATVSLGIGARSPAFSTTHPQWGSLVYTANADEETAGWIYTGSPVPTSLEAIGFGNETARPLAWLTTEFGSFLPTSPPTLPAPELELRDERIDEQGRRHIRAHAISPRGAPVLQIVFETATAPTEWRIDGVNVPPDQASRPLFQPGYEVVTIWTMPTAGVEFELVFDDAEPRNVWLADRSYDLPDGGDALRGARPNTAVPVATGDGTVISRKVTF